MRMTTLSHVYMTHAVLFPVLIIKQRTLFIHEKHKKLPIQSTVSLWFMGTNQEIKIKLKNSNKSNPEENTVFKLIYTTLIQYCSLRREHYKHIELAWTGIPPLFTLTGFIFTPRNQTDYFSFSPTLVSMTTEFLNLVLKKSAYYLRKMWDWYASSNFQKSYCTHKEKISIHNSTVGSSWAKWSLIMQTRHKDGAGLFKCNLSGFDSFIWPALLPPEVKEAKTISATWRQWSE